MVLQFDGGELVSQIRQASRPTKFETGLCGARGFRRRRLRQKLNERLHLLLRWDGQRFVFGDQCVFAHGNLEI